MNACKEYNPYYIVVDSIQKLVSDISDEKMEILKYHYNIYRSIDEIDEKILPYKDVCEIWAVEKDALIAIVDGLQMPLIKILGNLKYQQYESSGELWQQWNNNVDILKVKFGEMHTFGELIFHSGDLEEWHILWRGISQKLEVMKDHAETIHLKSKMFEILDSNERNDILQAIRDFFPLKHHGFEDINIHLFEQCYRDLKKSLKHNKDLWSKFKLLISMGITANSSQRVLLKRWMD